MVMVFDFLCVVLMLALCVKNDNGQKMKYTFKIITLFLIILLFLNNLC